MSKKMPEYSAEWLANQKPLLKPAKVTNGKGRVVTPHHEKNPQAYSPQELNNLSATGFEKFGFWYDDYEVKYAKNPSMSVFRKWRKVNYGKRNSAHPQARVVRGLWGQYPKFRRLWRAVYKRPKPKLVIRFLSTGSGYIAEIRNNQNHPVGYLLVEKTGKNWIARFDMKDGYLVLGDTVYIAQAHSAKLAISRLLGMPIFFHNGWLWSAHDVYKKIHYAGLPNKTDAQEPLNYTTKWDTTHCWRGGCWAWEYALEPNTVPEPVHHEVRMPIIPKSTAFLRDEYNSSRDMNTGNML